MVEIKIPFQYMVICSLTFLVSKMWFMSVVLFNSVTYPKKINSISYPLVELYKMIVYAQKTLIQRSVSLNNYPIPSVYNRSASQPNHSCGIHFSLYSQMKHSFMFCCFFQNIECKLFLLQSGPILMSLVSLHRYVYRHKFVL